jgi:hypothetical protein
MLLQFSVAWWMCRVRNLKTFGHLVQLLLMAPPSLRGLLSVKGSSYSSVLLIVRAPPPSPFHPQFHPNRPKLLNLGFSLSTLPPLIAPNPNLYPRVPPSTLIYRLVSPLAPPPLPPLTPPPPNMSSLWANPNAGGSCDHSSALPVPRKIFQFSNLLS